ncbi:MAG: GntR family transcriptional regulator [Rhizobium sp.]|nr:GntR family transcriptional regulator [Rhizobium sp.]
MPRPRKKTPEELEALETGISVIPEGLTKKLDLSQPKAVQVYEALRRAIIILALPPGSIINERMLCEQLEISRTPLREALLRLSSENLVTVVPNSGTFVSQIDLQTVFDGQLVRDALEMKVVRLAAVRMTPGFERQLDFNMHQQHRLAAERDYDEFYELDEAFHSMICEFGTSQRIWKIVNEAKAQLDRVRRLAIPGPNHLDIVLAEHMAIVDGLKMRDPEAAAAGMKVHLDRVFLSIRRLIVEKRDYFASDASEFLEEYTRSANKSA